MMPIQWSANVKLPYYGWFGRDDFTSKREARDFVAKMLRKARADSRLARPSYRARTYIIRPHLLRVED